MRPTIRSLRVVVLVVVILIAQVGARSTSGQAAPPSDEAKQFIGTWRLISDTSTGLMYYDGLGNMAAQVMPGRPRAKYTGTQPTPDEAKAAITGYLAYFGTSTVNVRAHTITHHRKGNLTLARSATMPCEGTNSHRATESFSRRWTAGTKSHGSA